MCKQVGVDPLNCTLSLSFPFSFLFFSFISFFFALSDFLLAVKGFWAVLGLNDFYYELAVQIVEVCMQTRDVNGGFIEVDALLDAVKRKRGNLSPQISAKDVEYAVSTLKALGEGFVIKRLGDQTIVQSASVELNQDHLQVLSHIGVPLFSTIYLPSAM
jgi:hypothetical protein